MSRLARLALADWPHLVLQPVRAGEVLFKDDEDIAALRRALLEASRQHDVAVHAYALAEDGLSLLATPATAEGLGLFMQAVGRRYVAGFNRRHGRAGALWAGRFRATVLDAAHYLLDAMVLLESTAWRKGLVAAPVDVSAWAPSSLPHHLGQRADPIVLDHAAFWATGNTPFEREAAWRQRMNQGLSATLVQTLLDAAHKGWALVADATVLAKGQVLTARRLAPKPRGRPRKAVSQG
jgi:putative transposase